MLILIPIVVLFVVILVPAIPKIGGDARWGLLLSGLTAAVLGGTGISGLIGASINGIDRIAWVIMLSIFGSIYAQSQVELGTMDTVLNTFRATFGKSTKGLVAAVIVTLVLAGSLLGDAIAAATVIGVLVIIGLKEIGLKAEQIGMIILSGAVLGSVMPPISQGLFLSSSLVGLESPESVLRLGYITVSIGVVIAILTAWRFLKIKELPSDLIPNQSVFEIISENWKSLIPLSILVVIIVAATGFSYNIFTEWGFFVRINEVLSQIPIIKGLTFRVVQALIIVLLISFLFPKVHKKGGSVIGEGLLKVSKTVQIQLCAGVMIGVFYHVGLISMVQVYAESLGATGMKLGGGSATMLVGMLTGSQTTAQATIITFVGPALASLGVNPTRVALGAGHLAMAGQSLPPVCLTAFVVQGLVGGVTNEKVDPVKIMLLALPVTLYFAISGFMLWFL